MRRFLIPWAFSLPVTASAVEVSVRHEGLERGYTVAPGTTVTDTWTGVGGRISPWWEKAAPHDVLVTIDVRDAGPDTLHVTVRVEERIRGRVEVICQPTLGIPRTAPWGRFALGGLVPGTPLSYLRTEILLSPDPPELREPSP